MVVDYHFFNKQSLLGGICIFPIFNILLIWLRHAFHSGGDGSTERHSSSKMKKTRWVIVGTLAVIMGMILLGLLLTLCVLKKKGKQLSIISR